MGIETLVGLSLASSAVAGVSGAAGSLMQGSAGKQAAFYQAQVAQNNAVLAEHQAQLLSKQGQDEVYEQGQKVGKVIGTQRASYAAAGVDVNEGTAADVQNDTAVMGRLDELRIYDQAMQKVYGARVSATNYRNEAGLDIMKGKNAGTAGALGAITSLVSSAGSFSSKWSGFQRTGAIPSWSTD